MTSIVIFIIIILAILAIFGGNPSNNQVSQQDEEPYWERKRRERRKKINRNIEEINELCDQIKRSNKITTALNKSALKNTLSENRKPIEDYIQFCEMNDVLKPSDESLRDIIYEAEYLLDPSQALDKELERTNKKYNSIYEEVNRSGEALFKTRNEALKTIEDAEKLINSIARKPKEFEKDIQTVEISREKFQSALDFGLLQKKATEQSVGSAGAGIATGAAVASMAPTAAMWVATTFGTASTGTAISALSGAAATNAALAWLGGGALATGGAGMAAGQALLALAGPVGWGVAGTSVLASTLLLRRKKLKIQETKRDEIARMKNCTASLRGLRAKIETMRTETEGLNSGMKMQITDGYRLYGADYTNLDEESRHLLGTIVNNTKSLAYLICKLVTEHD